MIKEVTIDQLQPGMMVLKVIAQSGPVKIRKVGMIRSSDMVKGLREMGVSLLEIDTSQSLTIADDVYEDSQEDTPTQKLLGKDSQATKRISDADKHFHRSLFLPALDQVPSRWSIYAKPYALLLGLVCLGFALGWGLTTGIVAISSGKNDELLVEQNPKNNSSLTAYTHSENQNEAEPSEVENNEESLLNQAELQSTQIARQENRQAPKQAANKISDATNDAARPKPVKATVAGIELSEGQQVLGYQGEDVVENTSSEQGNEQSQRQNSANTANTANTENADNQENQVDSALYRLVQEAAQKVDSRSESLPSVNSNTQTSRTQELVKQNTENLGNSDIPLSPTSNTPEPKSEPLVRIDQLSPTVLNQLPSMSFSAHMYATSPRDRWVRVNSRRLGEGDYIADGLYIKTIEAEKIILSFDGQDFSMNALSDW